MKIGPKYKIARRLGASVFEKTQTQKYALRAERKLKNKGKSHKPKTDFGIQLNEKQKARMFYGVSEKQFAKYVKLALSKKGKSPSNSLMQILEHRLDNVVWRAGILPTHSGARQAVSHGHFLVNGKKVYVPSYNVSKDDIISVREGSKNSKLFTDIEKRVSDTTIPNWMSWNAKKQEISINKVDLAESNELLFDLGQVIEYYQR